MRILFLTQGASLSFFYNLLQSLKKITDIEGSGWFVANKDYYEVFLKSHHIDDMNVIKEWEIQKQAYSQPAFTGRSAEIEGFLELPTLWPALIADRRVFGGPLCSVRQDYASQNTHNHMVALAEATFDALYGLYQKIQPEIVVSFAPNTMGALIGCSIAKKLSIPCFTLKSTKVGNLVTLSTDYAERHPHIYNRFHAFESGTKPPSEAESFALKYLAAVQAKQASYEGMLKTVTPETRLQMFNKFFRQLPRTILLDRQRDKFDPQVPPLIGTLYESTIGRNVRRRQAEHVTRLRTVNESGLDEFSYVFFPLNSEPEISLNVYSLFHRNQIEVARIIAESLPLHMKLVIKEHPRSWGARKPGYYRKLLAIPNVLIAPVDLPVLSLISKSKAVVVLSSFVGMEALIAGKPVVTIGNCMYDMLPEPLSWKATNLAELPSIIHRVLSIDTLPVERHLLNLIAAIYSESAPLDLYSKHLKKGLRAAGTGSQEGNGQDQLYKFAEYLLSRYNAEIEFNDKS